MSHERLLPSSPESERGVLCCCLLAPKEVLAMCAEKGLRVDHFYIPGNGTIFETLQAMWQNNEGIDFITLTQVLRNDGRLDEVGGASYVTGLFSLLPTAVMAESYIDILVEKWLLRELIRVSTNAATAAYSEQNDPWGTIDKAERDVLAIRASMKESRVTTAREAVMEAVATIQDLYESRGAVTGIPTGFTRYDMLTGGMHSADMIVIAARPSNGKTALAMNIAEHVALDQKLPVAVFSLEMGANQLMQRMLCSRARVSVQRIREGFLEERDFPALSAAASKIAESKIYIDDTPGISIQELSGKLRRLKQRYDIRFAVIDYLQLVKSLSKRAQENRVQEVAEVSSGIKGLAKELNIPIVVLAQLKRDFDQRALSERPRLSDLRESGAIEQDADTIAFLVREEMFAKTADEARAVAGQATLTIAKQRNGPLGDVLLTFLKEYTRFENRADEEEYEEPPQPALAL